MKADPRHRAPNRKRYRDTSIEGGFVPIPRKLLEHPGWRGLSLNARRFVDFLCIEQCAHAGKENGRLMATYRQLEAFGISRSAIGKAIDEVVLARIVDVRRGRRRLPSIYTLTFLHVDGFAPSNNWRLGRTAPKKQKRRVNLRTKGRFKSYAPSARGKLPPPDGAKTTSQQAVVEATPAEIADFPISEVTSFAPPLRSPSISTGSGGCEGWEGERSNDEAPRHDVRARS